MTETPYYNGFPLPKKQAYARFYYLRRIGRLAPETRFIYEPYKKIINEPLPQGSKLVMSFK